MNDSKLCILLTILLSSIVLSMCSTTQNIKAQDNLYKYLIYQPEGYNQNENEDYPLLIFLHGSGERGDDISKVKVHGPPKKIEAGESYPAIVVAPQCPEDVWWDTDRLEELLDFILNSNRIDRSRIYLTGLSMGGYGTWAWAIQYPEHFAAIAPICGGGETENISNIREIPTWVFHGAQDKVVGVEKSEEMVNALMAVGGKPNFTIYPEAGHDSWTMTYDDPKFWEWMFSQRKAINQN